MYLRSIGAAILVALALLALAENADSKEAEKPFDMVAKNGNDWARISNKKCANKKILALLPPGAAEQFMQATARVDGKLYPACWTGTPQGVMLVYEDGDQGAIPYMAFEPVQQI